MKQATVKKTRKTTARNAAEGSDAEAKVSLLPPETSASPKTDLAMGGAYEAADRMTQTMAAFSPANRSADRDLLPAKDLLDARSKDLVRNDAYVDNGLMKYKDSVVGARFQLNANPNLKYLSLQNKAFDETWLEEFQEEVEALWELGAEGEGRWIDAQRKKTATQMIRMGIAMELLQGEFLISSEWIRRSNRPFKTAFLMLDPTRLGDPGVSHAVNPDVNRKVRKGVRINAYGEAVGYFISTDHPHDYYPSIMGLDGRTFQYTPKETPFGRWNVMHGFEEARPGQSRGIPKLVSAMKEVRLTKSFRDVMMQNAIVNASYAAAIESELPTQQVFEMLGGTDMSPAEVQKAIAGYSGGFLGSLAEYLKNSNGTMMNGAKIPHLFPGTKLTLLPAGQGGPLGTDFEKSLIRYLAANLNISYEQLSGDFSGVNYSTLKGAINETQKHMEVVKRQSAERIANGMYSNWLEEQFTNGTITSMPRNAPNFFEGLNREAYSQAEWFNSGRGQIEELKETQAMSLRIKSKTSTFETEMSRLGKDWRREFRQMAREKAFAKKHGIELEFEDNQLNAASGAPREKQASEDEGEGPTNE